MEDRLISIGDMAKLNNITIQTLRYYEKMGLVTPKYINKENNYRFYSIEQSSTIDIIKYLKDSNFSLKEIKQFLSDKNIDVDYWINFFNLKKSSINEEIEKMKLKNKTIDKIIDSLEIYKSIPNTGTIVLEKFKKQYTLVYKGNTNYYQNPPKYEKGLIELKKLMKKNCIPYFCSNNPASITRKKYLNGGNLYCDELFVYVEEDYCKNKLCLTEIPGGVYFCIYCDDITDEEKYVYKLINYINENGIEIVGDLIQESLSDIIAIRENRKNLIMRIRIPIKFKK